MVHLRVSSERDIKQCLLPLTAPNRLNFDAVFTKYYTPTSAPIVYYILV
jgi:hypothetical protein